jgi:hypothetical protein
MVTRHAKTHALPSYQKGGVDKLLLSEQLCKLSLKLFLICQTKTGPQHGSFQLLCEFGVLDRCYPAAKLQRLSPKLLLHYSFPVSPRKVSTSEVANQLCQAPKPHKCICKSLCSSWCSCVQCNLPCSLECSKGAHIPCGNHSVTAFLHEMLPNQLGLSSTP